MDKYKIELCRRHLINFTEATKDNYTTKWFHRFICDQIDEFLEDDNQAGLMIFLPPQVGKFLKHDTPILTTTGFKNHIDLNPGDIVYNQEGQQVKVLANTGGYITECKRVKIFGGVELIAANEHEWLIECDREKYNSKRVKEILATNDLMIKQRRNPAIRINKPLQNNLTELPIDPYILGIWLGNGNKRSCYVTIGGQDYEHYSKFGNMKEVKPNVYTLRIDGLNKALRLNNFLCNKHIPQIYLNSSYDQRLELLRGLMDTDGYSGEKGRCEFSQMEGTLANDVVLLIRSLGIRVSWKVYDAKLYGVVVGRKVRLDFRPEIDVFRLKRKLDKFNSNTVPGRKDKLYHFVVDVSDYGPCYGNCIQVEGGIYLAGKELIATHNSELSSRRLPAYAIGKHPEWRIILTTYNQTFAGKFNRQIQGIISDNNYKQIFPWIRLPAVNEPYACNSSEIEIPDHEGSIKTIGIGGPLTGNKCDLLIMDDIYKDASIAWSPIERENIQEWYSTTAETRLHNNSKVIIVFTRWHEDDLAGYLLRNYPNKYKVLLFPAIKDENVNDYDTRELGEVLWPEHLSKEKLEEIRLRDRITFSALYQQDPKPSEGLLYGDFKEHERKEWGFIQATIDVADSGTDFLCSIVYEIVGDLAYVKDIIYTQEGHKITKEMLVNQFMLHKVNEAEFESNNQGNIFADDVFDLCRSRNLNLNIKKKYQSKNKESRILSASNIVSDHIIMPKDWAKKYVVFHEAIVTFKRLFKSNNHDDGPDALTSIAERLILGGVSGIC